MPKSLVFTAVGVGNAIFSTLAITTSSIGALAATGALGIAAATAGVNALTPKPTIKVEGQRLSDSRVTSSAEGQPINDVYGQFRLGGNLIWATRLKEVVDRNSSGGGKKEPKFESTEYLYSCSFAIGLCEGVVDSLDAIYFDGNEVDLDTVEYEFYTGTQDQEADPTIETSEGSGNVPAYLGLSYIVFKDLQLKNYGNRIPQVSCLITKGGSPINVSTILSDLCSKVGLTSSDIDVTEVSETTKGYLIRDVSTYREALEKLMDFYFIEAVDKEGKIHFQSKFGQTVHTIRLSDLVTSEESPYGFSVSRRQPEEMLEQVFVSFVDADKKYSNAVVASDKLDNDTGQTTQFSSLVNESESYCKALANRALFEDYFARENLDVSLSYNFKSVQPGDFLKLVIEGYAYFFKVTSVEVSENISLSSVSFSSPIFVGDVEDPTLSPPNYAQQTIDGGVNTSFDAPVYTNSTLRVLDLPILPGENDSNWQPKLAAWQSPWPGFVSVFRDDGSGSYTSQDTISFPSVLGLTTTVLSKGPTSRFDYTNTLTVNLLNNSDTLTSVSELTLLNGANTIALLAPSGEFEIIQFQNATLNGDGTYTLSKLLRGQLGTEYYMGDPSPIGSQITLVEPDILTPLGLAIDSIGVQNSFRYGPGNFPVTDERYTDLTYIAKSTPFRTYSPVKLEETYTSGNDIVLSWVRRDRLNSDSWEQVEIPLSEGSESYEVDIYDSDTVVRTLTANTTSVTYTSAQQTEDFGSNQTSLSWRVYQLSASYGRGTPAIG